MAPPLRSPVLRAVIFDVDGVLTDTAGLHEAAWKQVFDEFLARRGIAGNRGSPFTNDDYRRYVDGRPRTDGVATFLGSRGIQVPLGGSSDDPQRDTVVGIAKRKDLAYLAQLGLRGPGPFPSSVALLRALVDKGVRTAFVSGSRHAVEVLEAAGMEDLFQAHVDGFDAERLSLAGKPDPATFLEAARRLGTVPAETAVIEDALAGVEAGKRGGFGLVVGVDRAGQADALAVHGADLVVSDLGALQVETIDPGRVRLAVRDVDPASRGSSFTNPRWIWSYEGYAPQHEGHREALCTLGNGYFATRGAAPEAVADDIHYPGTYVAGCYNRVTSDIEGTRIENESLVNLPNWLDLHLRVADQDWFDLDHAHLLDYREELDLGRGVLTRTIRFEDSQGRRTTFNERRLVHVGDPHLAALECTVLAENWSGSLEIRAGLDGRVSNRGVRADRGFEGRHLVHVTGTPIADDAIQLIAETSQSAIRIAQAARLRVWRALHSVPSDDTVTEPGYVAHHFSLQLAQGESATVEKVVSLFTSRDPAISEAGFAAREAIARAGSFDQLLEAHAAGWGRLWTHVSLQVGEEEVEPVIRLHAFHLLQTLSRHTVDLDVGVPARGLHGEGYRGHIFWDEVLVLPFLTYRFPELSRELLRYRFRRLPKARVLAAEAGHAGAMFPWQSGSDGREETPSELFNPRSGRWVRDNSRLQRHVNLAIAYNLWHYYEVTGDIDFLAGYGAEMLVEIARFWTSLVTYDPARDRYEIRGVMGPDEYHDGYPGAQRPGIDNNAYTNVMVVWLLSRALELLEVLPNYRCDELRLSLRLRPGEVRQWEQIRSKMFVPFHADGVISQFEGYERLAELDWDAYRARYGNIGRLDLILEAEGDTPNRYKLSKQADVLMLFYLLSADELRELLQSLGYSLPPEAITRTVDYYLARTSHGSTLSRIVDAWVLARSDRRRSWASFAEALAADVADTQGGTTAEGIHLGAMVGTLDVLQRCYTGLEARAGMLWLNPALPDELPSMSLDLLYRGQWISLDITRERLRIASQPCAASPIRIGVRGVVHEVAAGTVLEVVLAPRNPDPRGPRSSEMGTPGSARSIGR